MKTMKNLSMIALVLVGAVISSCSTDDSIFDATEQNNVVTLTTSVSIDNNDATRALTDAGVKTFAVGDKIAVVYTNTSDATVKVESAALTAGDITDGTTASFTATLTNPKASSVVKYVYPAAMANEDGSINYNALNSQDGTLATLAANLDLAVYEGSLTATADFPTETCTMSNQLAILALTIKNSDGSSDLTSGITSVNVSDGTYTYAVTRTAAAGPIYVAIRPTNSANIEVSASDGTHNFTKSLTGKTYVANNGYSNSWRMAEGTNLAFVTNGTEIVNGATISGKLPNGYSISIAAGATVTLSSVTISATGASGIVCNGNANLVLSGTNTITSSYGCGIQAGGSGTTLTISGEGSLTVSSSNYGCAGIGSKFYGTCGDLNFTSGNISATGAQDGPGIGAGNEGQCGMITISNGAITAIGTSYGAGIGTGQKNSSCGDIKINGGSVTASSVECTGIGSADGGCACGNILISGGSVQATAGDYHSGIGAGWSDAVDGISRCGDILISKGTVTATGGMYAAAIGSGYGSEAQGDPSEPEFYMPAAASECGTITIKKNVTQVTANRGNFAPNAIGAGECSTCGTVTIEDGANVIQN